MTLIEAQTLANQVVSGFTGFTEKRHSSLGAFFRSFPSGMSMPPQGPVALTLSLAHKSLGNVTIDFMYANTWWAYVYADMLSNELSHTVYRDIVFKNTLSKEFKSALALLFYDPRSFVNTLKTFNGCSPYFICH